MEIPGYQIQRVIGKGGMATVYLAIQESLDRPVVLKVLDEVNADRSEDLIERFIAEGRIIASLHHPNIITIYDIGVADRSLYISMEYVQGGDMKNRMELPISADEALDYLVKVANALHEAHKHGIVHRDVKPANILFRDEDTPLLTDFGIAKQVDAEQDLTSTGIFLGSPNYVSPEQADGKQIDGRADIYSLGCIFYEMLTGNKPYLSDSVIEIVIAHKQGPIPRLPAEHQEFQPLLEAMMAKSRDQRIADAESLATEIEKLQRKRRKAGHKIADFDITSQIPGTPATGLSKKRANQVLGGLALLGLILFSTLKYVEINIKDSAPKMESVPTNSVVGPAAVIVSASAASPIAGSAADELQATVTSALPAAVTTREQQPAPVATRSQPPPEQVSRALRWLGRQSLDEFRLTYPPKDNAYYYFNRLLELEPGNVSAINGILEISDRYAVLAEQALAKNQVEKAAAYTDIGLRINPRNEALLTMKKIVDNDKPSFLATIKSLLSR